MAKLVLGDDSSQLAPRTIHPPTKPSKRKNPQQPATSPPVPRSPEPFFSWKRSSSLYSFLVFAQWSLFAFLESSFCPPSSVGCRMGGSFYFPLVVSSFPLWLIRVMKKVEQLEAPTLKWSDNKFLLFLVSNSSISIAAASWHFCGLLTQVRKLKLTFNLIILSNTEIRPPFSPGW